MTGTNLRQALGVYDNWMSFKRVTTSATRATSAKRTGLAGLVFGGGRGLVGIVDPAPRGGKIVVERRNRHGRWRRAATGVVDGDGAYRVPVAQRGAYRVKAAGVTGPVVAVR